MDLGQRYIEVDMGYEFDDWFIEELKSIPIHYTPIYQLFYFPKDFTFLSTDLFFMKKKIYIHICHSYLSMS